MRTRRRWGAVLFTLAAILAETPADLRGDGPADNVAANVRPIPPPGIELSSQDREALAAPLAELQSAIEALRGRVADKSVGATIARDLPDVEVFYWSVQYALEHNEFFAPADVTHARTQLALGLDRAAALARGETPWREQTGAVIRGYRSKIDHSVQPYAVYVPKDYNPRGEQAYRCDLWFHGRGETLSEVSFIRQRLAGQGPVASDAHFMVHPYGRYCNANKLAGEIDSLEILDHLAGNYRIDPDRIAVRGFSMGGAACWQFAVHYADRWFAATPGAGFSETPEFLKVFQQESLAPTPYEQKLWRMYDCTDWAINLFHCPTIAYSGEIDKQKQAADIMQDYLRREGIDLIHLIGPETGHKIHPDSLAEIDSRLAALAMRGRQRDPREIHFTTYTLRYPRMHWVQLGGLEQHWERARIDARIDDNRLLADTTNITEITFDLPAGAAPFDLRQPVRVALDGQIFDGPRPKSDRSWKATFHRDGPTWYPGPLKATGPRKRPDLQGPIDDAFLDSFVFVEPTGTAAHPRVEQWTRSEFAHAVEHWRKQFRGRARVVKDTQVDDALIASANLVLFGDPESNAVLAKIVDRLPIAWSREGIAVGHDTFASSDHGLILIAPNPLNPERYVVLNSGFTYREYDYLNNARQVPKLPDWAVVDVTTPPHTRGPGKIVRADFFDEFWRLKPAR